MRNVSIGMGESVEAIFPSASVPGGRNVAGGVDAEDPLAVTGRYGIYPSRSKAHGSARNPELSQGVSLPHPARKRGIDAANCCGWRQKQVYHHG